MTATNYLTFSPEGLEPKTVELLAELEKLYFEGAVINTDTLLKAGETVGIKKGKYTSDMIEGWDYWQWLPKPLIRESLKSPVKLSELFAVGGAFWLNTTNAEDNFKGIGTGSPTVKTIKLLGDTLIYPLTPNNFYFEIVHNKLYIKYHQIIGSRFIAYITE